MIDDMGIFRINIELASTLNPDRRVSLDNVMVDTGSEYNWIPEAVLAELGVNLRVDLARRELIPAGPVPVAAAA